MDVEKILAQLRLERSRLDLAIQAMEDVALNGQPRKGRPPGRTDKAQRKKREPKAHGKYPTLDEIVRAGLTYPFYAAGALSLLLVSLVWRWNR